MKRWNAFWVVLTLVAAMAAYILVSLLVAYDTEFTHLAYIPIILTGILAPHAALLVSIAFSLLHLVLAVGAVGVPPGGVFVRVLIYLVCGLGFYLLGTAYRKRERERLSWERRNVLRAETLLRIQQHPCESVQAYLDYALEQVIRLTDSRIGYIYFYDEQRREFTLNTWSSRVMAECAVANPQTVYSLENTGVWGDAVRMRRPVIVNDFQSGDSRLKGVPKGHAALRTFLTVPVFDGGRIVAVVGVANWEGPYGDEDVAQVTLLMNGVWEVLERKKAEIRLARERERFARTLMAIGDAVIATDARGRVELMNRVAEDMTGWRQEEAVGQPFSTVFRIRDERNGEALPCPVHQVLQDGKTVELSGHAMLQSRDGTDRPVEDSAAPIPGPEGDVSGVVVVFRDYTEKKSRLERITYLSFHDQLTGLYNRRFFEEELRRLDVPRQMPMTVVMADVNGLKLTNDAFGHARGDALLQAAARVLRDNCRADDLVCRVGGDEFTILLPRTDAAGAAQVIARFREAFSREILDSVPLSVSMGADTKTDPDEPMQEIFKKAEDRMYRSKLLESPASRGNLVRSIMDTLNGKSERERRHSERTADLGVRIAEAYGMGEDEVHKFRLASLFHDIGKIAVDERILEKEGPLTPEEWEEVRRHSEIGYRILCSVPEFAEVADSVLCHHEWWDGTGYPRGLRGEDIPHIARIMAVADAYEAMTQDRPYRAALPEEAILRELVRGAGTQFDPEVVRVFVGKVLQADWQRVADDIREAQAQA